jgi:hypothetical protein
LLLGQASLVQVLHEKLSFNKAHPEFGLSLHVEQAEMAGLFPAHCGQEQPYTTSACSVA